MSTCRDCGQEIIWARRSANQSSMPLDSIGTRIVLDSDRRAYSTTTYQRHVCDAEAVAAHVHAHIAEEQQDELQQAARGSYSTRQEVDASYDYAQNLREAWEYALEKDCPHPNCPAEAGQHCQNLTQLKNGHPGRDTVWPHPQRMPVRSALPEACKEVPVQ